MTEKTLPLVIQVSSGTWLMVGEGPISSACAPSAQATPAASTIDATTVASNTLTLLLKAVLLSVEGRPTRSPIRPRASSGPFCPPFGVDTSARWPISSLARHTSEGIEQEANFSERRNPDVAR